ncbi:MAG: undecaprenyl-diphosphatase [Candidatus Melainabacteria bacterium]|nr:MAG: undecaprenyl-diphosphatase [Candidatus Melainabacteria bacterium]
MSIVESMVLGVVQGLTEFLPISSTAHLRVVPSLLGWPDPGAAMSAVIQLGSVIAVIAYFRSDIIHILAGTLKAIQTKNFDSEECRLFGGIIIGTLPICILGLLLKHVLEQEGSPLRSLIVIGCSSIFMALFLLFAESRHKQLRDMQALGAKDGLLVGLGQAMALIPGCSRSGSTLTVAMLLNIKREDAARFSFLLGIPAIILSGLLELKEMLSQGLDQAHSIDLIVGLIISTIVSYLSIAWLLKYLRTHSTKVFVGYRLIFGLAVLVLSQTGYIH